MTPEEYDMHIRAGRYYGRESTCGTKIDYKSESSAAKSAQKLSAKSTRQLEAYPCAWCNGWHIGRAMSKEERDLFSDPKSEHMFPQETVHIYHTDRVIGAQLGIGPVTVHSKSVCADEYCCIHKPSDHPLKYAPLNWRGDRKIMERICTHGVGHPDPDDAAFRRSKGDFDSGIHGCDGCCA